MYIVERRAAAGGAACRWQVFTPVSRLSGVCWVERDRPHRIGLPGRERRVARGEPHTEIACRGRGGSSRWPVVGATIDAYPLVPSLHPECCYTRMLHDDRLRLASTPAPFILYPTALQPPPYYTVPYYPLPFYPLPSTLYPLPFYPLPFTLYPTIKHSHNTLPPRRVTSGSRRERERESMHNYSF